MSFARKSLDPRLRGDDGTAARGGVRESVFQARVAPAQAGAQVPGASTARAVALGPGLRFAQPGRRTGAQDFSAAFASS